MDTLDVRHAGRIQFDEFLSAALEQQQLVGRPPCTATSRYMCWLLGTRACCGTPLCWLPQKQASKHGGTPSCLRSRCCRCCCPCLPL
jgi:hypothetical protein